MNWQHMTKQQLIEMATLYKEAGQKNADALIAIYELLEDASNWTSRTYSREILMLMRLIISEANPTLGRMVGA